jgi:hypothetical protein
MTKMERITKERVTVDRIDSTFDGLFLAELREYLERFRAVFPDSRMYCRFVQAVKGVIAAGAPIITQVAAAVIQSKDPKRTFHISKRYYRLLRNPRFHHQQLLKSIYAYTRELFQGKALEYVLVILDFTNLEKPYGYRFEGLSTLKASGLRVGPRCRHGKVPGYNQLVGLAVGAKSVGLVFSKTISYVTSGFVSLNRDVFRAIRYSHKILVGHTLRFICDRGFDDEKIFALVVGMCQQFVIRLYHNRTVLLRRGAAQVERALEEIARQIAQPIRFDTWLKRGGRWHKCLVTLGYVRIWLPNHKHPYYLLVSHVHGTGQEWMLLTNVPITSAEQAREIWFNYRRRWRIETTFRFLQKEGLRWEDFKVLDLEAIRRLITLVLIAALFLLNIRLFLDDASLQILLILGGKQGLKSERDGPYLVLRGYQKLLGCLVTLAVLKRYGQLDSLLPALHDP